MAFIKKICAHILAHITKMLGLGAVVAVPFIIVYYVIKFLASNADSLFQIVIGIIPFVHDISGIGLLMLLIFLYLVGLVTTVTYGKKLIHLLQQFAMKIPLIKHIYTPAKGLTEMFASDSLGAAPIVSTSIFGYPDDTLGLLTSFIVKNGVRCVNFYYPTSPTPNSGFTIIRPKTEVRAVFIQPDEQEQDLVRATPDLLMKLYLSYTTSKEERERLKHMSLGDLLAHCTSCGTASPKAIVTLPLTDLED